MGCVHFRGDERTQEIYGLEVVDRENSGEISRTLLAAALNHCKGAGVKYMTFFCDEDLTALLEELGFWRVGEYLCYSKRLQAAE